MVHLAKIKKEPEAVLFADDNTTVRELCCRILQEAGYIVYSASDGVEAVSQFSCHRDEISLVILDMKMPHLDGFSAYKKIVSDGVRVKALLIMGSFKEELFSAPLATAGQVHWLMKPFGPSLFLQKIRAVLQS